MSKPVVVVGAGIAGLVCARRLHRAGIPILVIEASDRPGGRMKTDLYNGYRLDHGLQVLFTQYPHVNQELDLSKLNLRNWEPGSYIFDGKKLHKVQRDDPFDMAFSKLFTFGDKIRVLSLTKDCNAMSYDEIHAVEDAPTDVFLKRYGFSDKFIDGFARPFFGSIFVDHSLSLSRRMFMFVWKMLAEGLAAVPADGIEAIPQQIASDLPKDSIRCGARVAEIVREGGRATGVKLDTGEMIEASNVVISTTAEQASALTGLPTISGSKSTACLYFDAPEKFVFGAFIVLNGSGSGIVTHVAPMTNTAPEYGPEGSNLVAVSVAGMPEVSDERLIQLVKDELSAWFATDVSAWKFIRIYKIPYTQMPQPPSFVETLPSNKTSIPGLYFSAEFTVNGSIDGAIKSAIDCATLIESEVGAVAS